MQPLNLTVKNLSQSYAAKQIFKDFSYNFSIGCHVVSGANGVGKSTLLSLLAGVIQPDHGKILFNDIDLTTEAVKAKSQLAYVPDKALIYPFITGGEFLQFIKKVKKTSDITAAHEAMEAFKLTSLIHMPFSEMSFGTQKKFMITASLIGQPNFILMDEPVNGLDNTAKDYLKSYIELNLQKKIFIITTHDKDFSTQVQTQELKLLNPPHGGTNIIFDDACL